MKRIFRLYIALPALLLLGCQHNLSSDRYQRKDLDNPIHTYYAKVESIRWVEVSDKSRLADNNNGILAGGATGAIVGDGVGKGSGNTASTVVGAVIGATLGAFAEEKLGKQKANEYVVRSEEGKLFTVVQKDDFKINRGDQVIVQAYKNARSRLHPRPL